jgi:hypothetical protein
MPIIIPTPVQIWHICKRQNMALSLIPFWFALLHNHLKAVICYCGSPAISFVSAGSEFKLHSSTMSVFTFRHTNVYSYFYILKLHQVSQNVG